MSIYHDIFDIKEKAKGINSKIKGNRGELAACRFLKKWSGLEFNRVPNSGGLRWKNAESIVGDVKCEAPIPFVIEVKNYESLKLTPVLKSNSRIFKFYGQAYADGIRTNKWPILLARENAMPKDGFIIFVPIEIANELGLSLPRYYGQSSKYGEIYGFDSERFAIICSFDSLIVAGCKNKFGN